ncbi:MAG: RsmB/NOP family class I SAM-dependent RNA methyltransferase [Nanoarchaeota archaeon]|nr:RsmB/NOP family class I SAM-dependent RNA methyltransferase [Nanoarchaeota archaeon]
MKPALKKLCQELGCPDLINSLKQELPRYIRANQLIIKPEKLKKVLEKKGWTLKKIAWNDYGFKVVKAPCKLGNTLEHAMGMYYVQNASSMIPPQVLNPLPGERVLDLCASPGSKTTQISMLMKNKGVVVANDYLPKKIVSLLRNVQKCRATNVIGNLSRGEKTSFIEEFDKVLVDAPCTGLGAVHKDPKILKTWSPSSIKKLCAKQKKLVEAGFKALKKGGVMVYSTCTLSVEENEGIVNHLIKLGAKVESIKIKGLKTRPGIIRNYNPQVKKTVRVYPMDNQSEAFFIARIKK